MLGFSHISKGRGKGGGADGLLPRWNLKNADDALSRLILRSFEGKAPEYRHNAFVYLQKWERSRRRRKGALIWESSGIIEPLAGKLWSWGFVFQHFCHGLRFHSP